MTNTLKSTAIFIVVVSICLVFVGCCQGFHFSCKYRQRESKKNSKCAVSASATVRVKKSRFERNIECRSETLGFVGLYWVELSVCIIPPIIYNLLPPWMYPVLGNHINLFVCVLFVFAFGPICTTSSTNMLLSFENKHTQHTWTRNCEPLKKQVFLSIHKRRLNQVL
jgi:hypothetical protein